MIERFGIIAIAIELAIITVLLFINELVDNSNGDNGYQNNDNSPKNYRKYIEWNN